MAEVVLEQLTKVYPNGVQAVQDLDLHVANGDLVVLVGPSGCGKTTTLRLIAGLEEPSAGKILIGGRVVNTLPPHQRDVAMVFQRSTLYPHLDVRRNLSMSLQMRRAFGPLSRFLLRWLRRDRYAELLQQEEVIAETVDKTTHLLGLEEILNRLPDQLSGGQQQRVALGRAIVRRPAVFLLDEPLSHLDSRLRAELRHQLHLLQRQLRATMVYVTHDQAEAMTLADRVAVMDHGVVQQVDRPLEVYERPVNRFVAGFVGWPPMNFAAGELRQQDGRLSFVCDHWCLPVPSSKVENWQQQAGRAVTLGLRPEDIQLTRPRQGEATLPMEVLLVEPLGHSCLVTLRHKGWQALALADAGLGRGGGSTFDTCPTKQMVEVSFNMEHAHLFDRSTGLALSHSRPAG